MPRYTMPVEIECGVETCDGCRHKIPSHIKPPIGIHFGKECKVFNEQLRGSSRLPDCLSQAVPVEPAEEDQAAEEHECTGGCEVMTCDGYDGEGGCGDSFCVALRLDHDCLKAAPDSATPPAEEGERCESMSDKGHRCTMTDPHEGTGDEPHKARDGGLIWVGPPHPATPEQEGERVGTWTVEDDHAEGWDCSEHGHWMHGQERCPVLVEDELCGVTRP